MRQNGEEQIIRTVCNSHCGGICEIKVHVKNNCIVRIESGDGGGELEHRACARGRAYRQRVYAPDRILYPLRRTGKRGDNEFARISWDEALDTVAKELKRVKETYGNASILHFCSMADAFMLHHAQAIHKLLCQFGGYTAPWGTMSSEGFNFAAGVTYGTRPPYNVGGMLPEIMRAKLVIMWGWNPAVTSQGTDAPLIMAKIKEKGTRIIAIDPRYTDSAAAFADEWIPIRPNTDVAVFAAMAYVIITENLQDQEFIERYTFGFDKYKDYVLGVEDGVKKTPEWAASISDIPAARIASLARELATTKPAVINGGYSAGREAYGEQFHRGLAVLEAITGNTRIPKKSARNKAAMDAIRKIQIPSPPNQVEIGRPARWNALPYRGNSVNSSARVNVSLLADAILKGTSGGYPADYKFMWLANNNYLNQLADVNKAAKAFRSLEFILVMEQFMTATAQFADVLLPVCTYLERNDLYAPRSGLSYGLVGKAIAPLGESKSQLEICELLAKRLGINDYNDKTDEEWIRSMVGTVSKAVGIPEYEALQKQGIHKVKAEKPAAGQKAEAPDNDKVFPSPSGKIEIYSQAVEKMNNPGIPPIPKYIEAWEGVNDPLTKKYPLQLLTPHFRWRAHSQFDNLPWLRDLQPQVVTISSRDAGARGIRDGELVRIFNDRGEVRIPARVTERIMPGVVDIHQGAWYKPDKNGIDYGGCANVLTKNVTSPAGAFPSNTTLVQIARIED